MGMQPPGSSVTRTKKMLAYVGQKVWVVSNWTQHMPTSCNIGQHGVQTNATCCAQHVAIVWTGIKAPCKRTQHVGATSPNIVGIVLANVGFRVFKRSQHVGQCCFYGNTLGSMGLIFTQNSLLNCNVVTFVPPLWRSMNADDGKRENASHLFSAILKILLAHKQEQRA